MPNDADKLSNDTWQDEENKHKLESPLVGFLRSHLEYVTFTTPDLVKYPVASRSYLDIHAACAKVANLSEAGECIDKFYQDLEERQPLTPTAAQTADMLELKLLFLNKRPLVDYQLYKNVIIKVYNHCCGGATSI